MLGMLSKDIASHVGAHMSPSGLNILYLEVFKEWLPVVPNKISSP